MTTRRSTSTLDEVDLRRRVAAGLNELGAGLVALHLVPPASGGGNSGLTCLATVSGGGLGGRLVLKVAPPGLLPVRNRDVLRQAKLLRALACHRGVPVPEVVFTSEGEPANVPPFVAMRFVEGEAVEPVLDTARPAPGEVGARALAAASLLAVLHGVDAEELGLGAEPEMTSLDELAKWRRAFDTVEERYRAGHAEVVPLLRASAPTPVSAVVSHGDYRLGNMLCSGDRIGAVIDWEIWSRTDPRMDLAWLLWMCDASHPSSRGPVSGMPTQRELVEEYAARSGREVDSSVLTWFRALVCYKQAATAALLAKHGRRRQDGSAHHFEQLVPRLLSRSRTLIERQEATT